MVKKNFLYFYLILTLNKKITVKFFILTLTYTFLIMLFSNEIFCSDMLELQANIEKKIIYSDERVKYSIYSTLEYRGGEFIPEIKEIKNFEIINSYSDIIGGSSSFSFSDGKKNKSSESSSTRIYNFILKPTKSGIFNIGPFKLFSN